MKKKKGLLYYVYCALGEKSHPRCSKTADRVAVVRLIAFLSILITNSFIVAIRSVAAIETGLGYSKVSEPSSANSSKRNVQPPII